MKKILQTITLSKNRVWLQKSSLLVFSLVLIFAGQVSQAQTSCVSPINFHLTSEDASTATANDAKIRISGAIQPNYKVAISPGSTYTGTATFATASLISSLTNNYVSQTLPTPTNTAGEVYTIRVWREDGSCYTDQQFTLPYVNFNAAPLFPDIMVTMTKSGGTGDYHPLNSTATIQIAVKNEGTGPATGVKYMVELPAGLTATAVSSGSPSAGTFVLGTGVWDIGNLAVNQTVTLTITGTVSTRGIKYAYANLTDLTETDLDSKKDATRATNSPGEDDLGAVCISTPIDICNGDEYKITLPSYTGIVWKKDGQVITGSAAGQYVINADNSLTIYSGGIGEYTYSTTFGPTNCPSGNCCPLKVEPGIKPSLSQPAPQILCFNQPLSPFTVTNSQANTGNNGNWIYQWYNDNGTNNPTTTQLSGQTTATLATSAMPTAVGTYKFKLKVFAENHPNCADSVSVELTIKQLPTPTIASNSPVCAEQTINLTAGGGTSYAWTGPAGFTSTSSTPSRANAVEAYEGTYAVTVTNGQNCSASTSVVVIVNDKPANPLVTNKVFCEKDLQASLTANASALGSHFLQWYGDNSTGGIASTTSPIHNPTIAGVTLYYVSQKHETTGCESNRSTITVTVNPKPAPPTADPLSVCQGSPVVSLTANAGSTGYTLKWYDVSTGGTATHVQPSSPAPSTATVGSTTYYVSRTDNVTTCESDRASLLHTVRPTPVPTIASNSPVCAEQTINLTAGGGTSYAWTGPAGFTSTSNTPSRANAIEAYEGTYAVTVTNGQNCSASTSVVVIVNDKPVNPLVTNKVFCEKDLQASLTANATALGGHFLQWYGDNSTGGIASTASPVHNPTIAGVTLYYVSQKNTTTECESNRATITVTVNPKPAPPVAEDKTYCQGVTATALTANPGSTGFTVLWWGTSSTGGVTTHVGTTGPIPSTNTVGTTTYYVSKKDDVTGCESDRDDAKVIVNPTPNAPTVQPVVACQNAATVTLSATADPGNTIVWYNGGVTSTTAPPSITSTAGVYYVNVSQIIPGTGCESPMASVPVTINPLPVATVVPVSSLCIGSVSQNNAKLILTRYRNTDEVSYNIGSTYTGVPTSTAFATVPAGGVFASNLPNPTNTAGDTYTVRIKNSFGCTKDEKPVIAKKDCGCPGGYCEPATISKIK